MFYRAVIENNVDPDNLQKVQIRILGIHSQDKEDIPTEILPWAEPALPLTMGKVDGGYGELEVPNIDDWVFVFFENEDFLKSRPFYFGIVRTNTDRNKDYKQGSNHVVRDRWENNTIIDGTHFERTDTFKNNLEINTDHTKYTDHFGNTITINEDMIEIVTKGGDTLSLNDSDNNIELYTKGGNVLEMKDVLSNIKLYTKGGNVLEMDDTLSKTTLTTPTNNKVIMNGTTQTSSIENGMSGNTITLLPSGKVNINSKDIKDVAVGGMKLSTWLSTHTHIVVSKGAPTLPPTEAGTLPNILYPGIQYAPPKISSPEITIAINKKNMDKGQIETAEELESQGVDPIDATDPYYESHESFNMSDEGDIHRMDNYSGEGVKPPQLDFHGKSQPKTKYKGEKWFSHIVIHCTASAWATKDFIYKIHVKMNKWRDIGYNHVIQNGTTNNKGIYNSFIDGKVFDGRPISSNGAHCPELNKCSIGISLAGEGRYTKFQLESMLKLLKEYFDKYKHVDGRKDDDNKPLLGLDYNRIVGHYENDSAKQQGKTCPVIDMDKFREGFKKYYEEGIVDVQYFGEFQYIIEKSDNDLNKKYQFTQKHLKNWEFALVPRVDRMDKDNEIGYDPLDENEAWKNELFEV